MRVITRSKAKELLGIADTSKDTLIDAKIPYIDAKVKQITKNRYNMMIYGTVVQDSQYVSVNSIIVDDSTGFYRRGSGKYQSGINNPFYYEDLGEYLEIGQLLEGTGIAAETYIEEIFYDGNSVSRDSVSYETPVIKMSAVATSDSTDSQIFTGISIAYQDIIAKGIQYLINGTSTTLPTNSLSSKSIGPTSKSFSNKSQALDNRYGMPAWFVSAFPEYASGH